MIIRGEFDVKLNPLETYTKGVAGISLGRMSIDKTFHGELSAKSGGEMLSAMTPIKGSAGYVAIEQVDGTLCGKSGTFVLQHFGTISSGKDLLILEVVPGSGTGELLEHSGKMEVKIVASKHLYSKGLPPQESD